MKFHLENEDILYQHTHDSRCSRCREVFREDEVPLRLFTDPSMQIQIVLIKEYGPGQSMLQFCEKCTPKVLL